MTTNAITPGTTVIDRAYATRDRVQYATLMVVLSPVIETGPRRGTIIIERWDDDVRMIDHVWADEVVPMRDVLQSQS